MIQKNLEIDKWINLKLNRQKGTNVKEIKISSSSTLNSPQEIAEEFNDRFTNIGPNFASEIPPCDIPPKSYLIPSNTAFSLQNTSQLLKKTWC